MIMSTDRENAKFRYILANGIQVCMENFINLKILKHYANLLRD